MNYKSGMDLITQRLSLKDFNPEMAKSISEKYGIKEEDAQFIRKGIVPSDLQFEDGERAVVSYITTGSKDRDNEIVDPKGAILEDYRKNPVVLFGHDYRSLPIGMNMWIKADDKGLIAKTRYATHEDAEKIYQYRKGGFPLAESIGFVPLEWTDYNESERNKNGGVRRTFTKWLMLEYSDVAVPSNPDALMIAVSKGILGDVKVEPVEVKETYVEKIDWICPYCKNEIGEKELYNDGTYYYHRPCKDIGAIVLPKETVEKPGWDETEGSFRYRVREPGLFQEGTFRTVPIKRDKPRVNSVMGRLKNQTTLTVQSVIFPKEDDWTLASAKEWLSEHEDLKKAICVESIESDDVEEKEGRVLSSKNRTLISKCVDEMTQAIDALNELLKASESTQEESFEIDDDIFEIEDEEKEEDLDWLNDGELDIDIDNTEKDKELDINIEEFTSKLVDSLANVRKTINVSGMIDETLRKLQGKVT